MYDIKKIIDSVRYLKENRLYENSEESILCPIDSATEVPTVMMVNEGLSVDIGRVYINENYVHETSIEDIARDVTRENEITNVVKSEHALKESNDITDFINKVIVLYSDDPPTLTECVKYYTTPENGYNVFSSGRKDYISEFKNGIISALSKKPLYNKVENVPLDEGMVKIPTKTYKEINNYITYFLYESLSYKTFNDPDTEHMYTILSLLGRTQEDVDHSLKMVREGGNISYDGQFGMVGNTVLGIRPEDMPYKTDMTTRLTVVFRTEQDTLVEGSMEKIYGLNIFINLFGLKKVLDTIDDLGTIADTKSVESLRMAVRDVESTIEHELIHVVQEVVFAQNEKQSMDGVLSKRSGVEGLDEDEEYLLSKVEFDPQINNVLNKFNSYLSSLQAYTDDIDQHTTNELMKYHTGAIDHIPDEFVGTMLEKPVTEIFKPVPFMILLKKHKMDMWKAATKKLMMEI